MASSRRRRFRSLLAVAVALVAACGLGGGDDPGASGARPTAPTATVPPAPTTTALARTAQWEPGPGEPAVEVKLAAARAVEAVGNHRDGEGTVEAARARLAAAGLEAGFADSATLLLGPGQATAAVVYPQLSGLATSEAGVMLVVDIRRATDAGVEEVRRTLDVRVAGGAGRWRATAVAADPPAASGAASDAAIALADAPSLDLSVEAADDLRRGAVDERLVALLSQWVAEGIELGVTVFSTGHPANVFNTGRMSNHTAGRAVDIWAVGGAPMAGNRDSPVLRDLVARAIAAGATEIGAPFDTDGAGGLVFTDTVHEDHLHIAFDR